jgi:hypothetical protein
LQDELSKKADKSDIFNLQNEKADKDSVDSEFKRVNKDLDILKL